MWTMPYYILALVFYLNCPSFSNYPFRFLSRWDEHHLVLVLISFSGLKCTCFGKANFGQSKGVLVLVLMVEAVVKFNWSAIN